MIMKIMVLADIHQAKSKWGELIEAVKEETPELVAVAGDLLPKENGILEQLSFLPTLREYVEAIRKTGAEMVFIPGNDDNQLAVPEMEKGDKEGLWHYVSDRVKEIKGYEFCGCPWVRDYPFGYKHWVAPERAVEVYTAPVQLGSPVHINYKNEIEEIPDLKEYLSRKPSIQESLESMAKQLKDISNSIWLIHGPPAYLDFDLCGSGDRVGSPAVYEFLWEKQPLLSVHGHIHEAPECNGNIWVQQLGRTVCIQPGQMDRGLYYVTFTLQEGSVSNMIHSIYGKR